MAWQDIWTQSVQDTVVGGLILAGAVGAAGAAVAWVRHWRVRPLAWLKGILQEDASLNLAGGIAMMLAGVLVGVSVSASTPPSEAQLMYGGGVLFALMVGLLGMSLWGPTYPVGIAPSLFYRAGSRPIEAERVSAPETPAASDPSPSINAIQLKRAVQTTKKDFSKRDSPAFNVIKALHQTLGQPAGLELSQIAAMRELTQVDVALAIVDLSDAGLVFERKDSLGVPRYRLTVDGIGAFQRWMRYPASK